VPYNSVVEGKNSGYYKACYNGYFYLFYSVNVVILSYLNWSYQTCRHQLQLKCDADELILISALQIMVAAVMLFRIIIPYFHMR
jgi:hypothetical protein